MQSSRGKKKEICLIFVQSDLLYSKDILRDIETPVQNWYYV